jgi:hypothetical protein
VANYSRRQIEGKPFLRDLSPGVGNRQLRGRMAFKSTHKLVPKKGNLKILDNWRGIMLIESPSKILSAIMANRIQEQILEPEGLEEQSRDGIFTVKMALQKRHEHGLSTWGFFIDLVKAFDSVSREGLFTVLEKFGIPPKMLRLIIRFHSDLIVKVNIGDNDCLLTLPLV